MRLAVRAGIGLIGRDLEVKPRLCIWIRDGVIESIEHNTCPQSSIGGDNIALTPQPANAHVHSADHLFPEYGIENRLEELVKPPYGLKHRLLSKASRGELVEATLRYYRLSWGMGIGLLVDFREMGGFGCTTAKEALKKAPPGIEVLVLGRPGVEWPRGCDGLGLSSTLDYNPDMLKALVSTHRPAMVHIAETYESRLQGDFEYSIEHGFDGIIHGVFLSREDLAMARDRGMGLVLCIRSNLWHGIGIPPIKEAFEEDLTMGLGTDNASWMPPNIWEEARALLYLSRLVGIRDPGRKILRMLFLEGYKIPGQEPRVVEEGEKAHMLLFRADNLQYTSDTRMEYWFIKRLGAENIIARIDIKHLSWLGFS
ncbi:MAG: amidohydrolase family protein [Desulfurococcales archaeon]|nr:amidohydrolase family protein [Desulfurococcales archaeon]